LIFRKATLLGLWSLEITAELPGLEEKDVTIEVVDNVLTINGDKNVETGEETENRHMVERSYGAFSRSVELPAGVKPEDVTASLAKGVLTVTVPKPAQARGEADHDQVRRLIRGGLFGGVPAATG
jgi:HSP20 family protein